MIDESFYETLDLDELTPIMLDWAVGTALKHIVSIHDYRGQLRLEVMDWNRPDAIIPRHSFNPSTNGADCDLLIERYGLSIAKVNPEIDGNLEGYTPDEPWICGSFDGTIVLAGADHRIAVCRNIIAAETGYHVRIPLALVTK